MGQHQSGSSVRRWQLASSSFKFLRLVRRPVGEGWPTLKTWAYHGPLTRHGSASVRWRKGDIEKWKGGIVKEDLLKWKNRIIYKPLLSLYLLYFENKGWGNEVQEVGRAISIWTKIKVRGGFVREKVGLSLEIRLRTALDHYQGLTTLLLDEGKIKVVCWKKWKINEI